MSVEDMTASALHQHGIGFSGECQKNGAISMAAILSKDRVRRLSVESDYVDPEGPLPNLFRAPTQVAAVPLHPRGGTGTSNLRQINALIEEPLVRVPGGLSANRK